MPRISARFLLVPAALAIGMAVLTQSNAGEATNEEYKSLVEQDSKLIVKAVESVDKAADAKAKKSAARSAAGGIKSSALIMAGYSNAQITGKDSAADGKAAAVRDEAIKIFKAAADGKLKEAGDAAKGLASVKPAAGAKKIDLIKEFGSDVTSKEVMINFMKTNQYGTNAEADIIAHGKKSTAKPADAAAIAHRVLAMGEWNKTVMKAENAADKAKWKEFNDKMIASTEALLAATKKKSSAADMAKAFTSVNATCSACHDEFK